MKRMMLVAISAIVLVGCATKQYPQASSVTSDESSTYDCQGVKQEIAKTKSIQNEIETTGQFDGRTVMGALGDFGIGNGMAKTEARKKAQLRLNQLQELKKIKCDDKI